MGPEAIRRELQVFHSTSWKVSQQETVPKDHLSHMVAHHHGLAAEVKNKLWSKCDVKHE